MDKVGLREKSAGDTHRARLQTLLLSALEECKTLNEPDVAEHVLDAIRELLGKDDSGPLDRALAPH